MTRMLTYSAIVSLGALLALPVAAKNPQNTIGTQANQTWNPYGFGQNFNANGRYGQKQSSQGQRRPYAFGQNFNANGRYTMQPSGRWGQHYSMNSKADLGSTDKSDFTGNRE